MEKSFFLTSGRINRKPFIIRLIILLIIICSSLILLGNHSSKYHQINKIEDIFSKSDYMFFSFFILSLLILLIVQIIKRLHDLDLNGSLIIISILTLLIPGIGPLLFLISLILLFVKDGSKGFNKYGDDPLKRIKESDSSVEVLNNLVKKTTSTTHDFISKKYERVEKIAEIKYSLNNLKGCNWILLNDKENNETVYIFRDNYELLISINGIVSKSNYEFIIDNNSILITSNNIIEIFDIVLMKDDILLLNKFSTNNILYFANKTKFKDFVKSSILERAKSYERANKI